MRTLITGVAGSGKTTIVTELKKRGYTTIDLDNCGVCVWVNKETGEEVEYQEGAGKEWIENHRWQVVVPKLIELLNSSGEDRDIFVGGKVARVQLKEISEVFDTIYLLKPDDLAIHERLSTRTTNHVNFAKTDREREAIVAGRRPFEEACLTFGAISLENHETIEEVVGRILNTYKNKK